MPLLQRVAPTGRSVSWTFGGTPWLVVDGKVVEHCAGRDDVGVLGQPGAWRT